MKDLSLFNALQEEVAAGRVDARTLDDLTIYKYSKSLPSTGEWNETNKLARGIIIKQDGTIVARPFPKFFNLFEVEESKPENLPWHEKVSVFEKLDGSCAIGHHYSNEWRFATPGSLDSDQAKKATDIYISRYAAHAEPRMRLLAGIATPIFEVIYSENKIVCDYSNDPRGHEFLCLLAIVGLNGVEWSQDEVDAFAEMARFPRPRRYEIDIRSEIPFSDNEEGYVCLFEPSQKRVKVKSPTYVQIHKLLEYMTSKGVIELIRSGDYTTASQALPDNLRSNMDDIRAHVMGLHSKTLQEANGYVCRMLSQLGTNRPRKDYALWIQSNVPAEQRGLVFTAMDNKDITEQAWKNVINEIRN